MPPIESAGIVQKEHSGAGTQLITASMNGVVPAAFEQTGRKDLRRGPTD
jgi:hypothetical protein